MEHTIRSLTLIQDHIYVVRHHESHIMSEKKYFSFWQIWILQILSFKSIYNLPYFIVRKNTPKSDRKLESCMAQFSFPSVFLAFGAFMISDFIRVTWWRTTYLLCDMHSQNELHECNYASDDQGPPFYETRLFALCLSPNFTVGYLDKQKGMRVTVWTTDQWSMVWTCTHIIRRS